MDLVVCDVGRLVVLGRTEEAGNIWVMSTENVAGVGVEAVGFQLRQFPVANIKWFWSIWSISFESVNRKIISTNELYASHALKLVSESSGTCQLFR